MYWNEKIDIIKKKYSNSEFSVPYIKRKDILRKIETEFIRRNEDYYLPNNFNERFCKWWDNLNVINEEKLSIDLEKIINQIIEPEQKNWIACEFSNHILIYKITLNSAIDLISFGLTWVKKYHIIDCKYNYLIGLNFEKEKTEIKYCGDEKRIEEIKNKLQQ